MNLDWLIRELRSVGIRITRVFLVCWLLYTAFLMVATCAAGYVYGRGSPWGALAVGLVGAALALLPVTALLLFSRRD